MASNIKHNEYPIGPEQPSRPDWNQFYGDYANYEIPTGPTSPNILKRFRSTIRDFFGI